MSAIYPHNSTTRNYSGDFVKGVLMIGMVLIHSSSLFAEDSVRQAIYQYLYFVSGAWIFITGLLISLYYGDKFATNSKGVSLRLAIRGLKLLLLVTLINYVAYTSGLSPQLHDFSLYFYIYNVLLLGDFSFSFEILVPIAELLIISPIILRLKKTGIILSIGMFFLANWLSFTDVQLPYNFKNIVFGILGILTGVLIKQYFASTSKKAYRAYFIYAILIYVLNIILVDKFGGFLVNDSLAILSAVTLLFCFGNIIQNVSSTNFMVTLGQHSLFLYMWQMIILRMIHHAELKLHFNLGFISISTITITLVIFTAIILRRIIDAPPENHSLIKNAYSLAFR